MQPIPLLQDEPRDYLPGGDVAICALMFSKRLNLLSYARQRCEQAVSKTSDLTTICKDLTQLTA